MTNDELESGDTHRDLNPHARPITGMSNAEVITELVALLSREGCENEARVVLYLARRFVLAGAAVYGSLQLNDGRDNLLEAGLEGADLMFYLAKHALEAEAKGGHAFNPDDQKKR